MSHTLINCTCKNRLCFTLLPFTLIPQYFERFNWSKHAKAKEIWRQNSEIHSAFACFRWRPPWFPDLSRPCGACVKHGRGKHMFGLSLFRPSRQSNTSKIQISPPLGEQDHSNALPQGTIKSPPHALRITLIAELHPRAKRACRRSPIAKEMW